MFIGSEGVLKIVRIYIVGFCGKVYICNPKIFLDD